MTYEPTSSPSRSGDVRLLLTAEQAFPTFEEAVLAAERRVAGCFRIFDPMTRLRSEAALAIGEHWFDLLLHVLRKGVQVDLFVSDFDPIVAAEMHFHTWSSMRKLWAIAELAGPEAKARILPGMHPARMGPVAATALWPIVGREISDLVEWLNSFEPLARRATFRNLPGLGRWIEMDEAGEVVQARGGPYPLHPVTHHQKIATIDDELLYIGGLDLNPRRYDTIDHHRRGEQTWHDVQLLVRGPVAKLATTYLDTLSSVISGERAPPDEDYGFRTTISARRAGPVAALSPAPVRSSIDAEIKRRAAACEKLIYLETQFFRDFALADALARVGREKPELRLLMILPAAPDVVAFDQREKIDARFGEYLQVRCIEKVRDALGDRCYFAAPAQRRATASDECAGRGQLHGSPLIYVHAKLCIFDRKVTMVSSANLNGRSLHWDTEAGLVHEDAAFAEDALKRCLDHWFPGAEMETASDLVGRVREQAELDVLRQPENRGGFLLPYDTEPARAFGRSVPGFPHEMV